MDGIRLIGRGGGGRCVYCHDALSGAVKTCPECGATWHDDCGEGARRCSTVGCSGPAPGAESRADDLSPARPRPTEEARRAVRESLLGTARWAAVLAVAFSAFLLWPVVHWTSFWGLCCGLSKSPRSVGPVSTAAIFLILAFVTLVLTVNWLRQVPGLLRTITTLLADTKPTAMRLTVSATGGVGTDLPRTMRTTLEGGGTSLSISFGQWTTPGTLADPAAHQDEPVLVYGVAPGPYLIEFRDGSLALAQPN